MKTALLITTYNWKEALSVVLESLRIQSQLPDEVLIADDGSNEDTKEIIDQFRETFYIPVKHIWHEDLGFRRSKILNKAIAQSETDYIIQIDGDCIMHKDFIKDHITNSRPNLYLYGSRVHIRPEYVNLVLKKKLIHFDIFSKETKNKSRNLHIPFFSTFYKPQKETKRVRGCNLSYWKKDFIAVNGYDENYEGWGREDTDITMRLTNLGLLSKKLRYIAIEYHIYHKNASKDNLNKNEELYLAVKQNGNIKCENGISKYL